MDLAYCPNICIHDRNDRLCSRSSQKITAYFKIKDRRGLSIFLLPMRFPFQNQKARVQIQYALPLLLPSVASTVKWRRYTPLQAHGIHL